MLQRVDQRGRTELAQPRSRGNYFGATVSYLFLPWRSMHWNPNGHNCQNNKQVSRRWPQLDLPHHDIGALYVPALVYVLWRPRRINGALLQWATRRTCLCRGEVGVWDTSGCPCGTGGGKIETSAFSLARIVSISLHSHSRSSMQGARSGIPATGHVAVEAMVITTVVLTCIWVISLSCSCVSVVYESFTWPAVLNQRRRMATWSNLGIGLCSADG
jgi:hypothetical protein